MLHTSMRVTLIHLQFINSLCLAITAWELAEVRPSRN
jgi:hypothetical protein